MSENARNIHRPGTDDEGTLLTPAESTFAQRAGAALRTPEPLPAGFEERVMRAVVTDGGIGSPGHGLASTSWWTRPHRLTLSPLGGLALAAGFAGLMALGAYGLSGALGPSGVSAADVAGARSDTVHLVRFVFVDASASRVALAGDFNGWSADARPLAASAVDGVWSVTVPLAPGRYEYAFVVDGARWVADPLAGRVSDEFGGQSSVIRVDGGATRTM